MTKGKGKQNIFKEKILDLSTVFEAVGHGEVVHRLEHLFVLSCPDLSWLECHLPIRIQSFLINQFTSKENLLGRGVQWCSVLDRVSGRVIGLVRCLSNIDPLTLSGPYIIY